MRNQWGAVCLHVILNICQPIEDPNAQFHGHHMDLLHSLKDLGSMYHKQIIFVCRLLAIDK